MFYLKLAWRNIRKSFSVFAPFLLASLTLFVMVCSTFLISNSAMMQGRDTLPILMRYASVILSIFAVIMELYSYRFLTKQRNTELGLYQILGMNKKQISWIATLELVSTYLLTISIGSILSAVFSSVFNLIFVRLVNLDNMHFSITVSGLVQTYAIFAVIFLLLIVTSFIMVARQSGLALFHSKNIGEKEPRGNIFLALLSILATGGGYYLSLTSPKLTALAVLTRFFWAVILVIIGTYLLFISFTTWYLKRLRKSKKYYYQPNHFISVSQLIFRMKQNAVGLANITLLAIMAFVAIATTSMLYGGNLDRGRQSFPRNTRIDVIAKNHVEADKKLQSAVLDQLDYEVNPLGTVSEVIPVAVNGQTTHLETGSLSEGTSISDLEKLSYISVISQEDFRAFGNDLPKLKEGQAVFYYKLLPTHVQTVSDGKQTYHVTQNLRKVTFPGLIENYNPGLLVVPSDSDARAILKNSNPQTDSESETSYTFYLDLTKEDQQALRSGEKFDFSSIFYYDTRQDFQQSVMEIMGGFFFIGLLLGIAFLLGAALIIYYKQYSEGHEDRKSYKILQEVGMSRAGVKKTINSQVVLVFFMPLTLAVVHFLVALPMLKQIILLLGIQNDGLSNIISAVTIGIIVLIYYLIYRLTSRVYLKIVER